MPEVLPKRTKKVRPTEVRSAPVMQAPEQAAPPQRPAEASKPLWSTVVKRARRSAPSEVAKATQKQEARPNRQRDEASLLRRRIPRREATVIGGLREGATYGEVMRRVVAGVNLQEIGVEISR